MPCRSRSKRLCLHNIQRSTERDSLHAAVFTVRTAGPCCLFDRSTASQLQGGSDRTGNHRVCSQPRDPPAGRASWHEASQSHQPKRRSHACGSTLRRATGGGFRRDRLGTLRDGRRARRRVRRASPQYSLRRQSPLVKPGPSKFSQPVARHPVYGRCGKSTCRYGGRRVRRRDTIWRHCSGRYDSSRPHPTLGVGDRRGADLSR